jgi:hypothetical protein
MDRVCAKCGFRTAGWSPARCPLCKTEEFRDAEPVLATAVETPARPAAGRRAHLPLAVAVLVVLALGLAVGIALVEAV